MTRNKRANIPALQVHLLREGLVESVHQVEVVITDERGRVLFLAGQAETTSFIRSALKPFQASASISSGLLERYGLSDKDLAIICSSHQGTLEQSRQVFNILWHCDIDPAALQCPMPDNKQSRLQHNCSGKHAAMLALSQQRNWPLHNYLEPHHPVQQLILGKIAELLAMPAGEFIGAHDDCGAPTYLLQIRQMAQLYAQLSAGKNLDLERIVRSMTYYPDMIAGEGRFDTELIRLSHGELISKGGAEGIQCIGKIGQGMGCAIKVLDGSTRAKHAVAIEVLKQMAWISPSIAENLSEKFMNLDQYKRMEVIGEVVMP